jgi:hypothetical protein
MGTQQLAAFTPRVTVVESQAPFYGKLMLLKVTLLGCVQLQKSPVVVLRHWHASLRGEGPWQITGFINLFLTKSSDKQHWQFYPHVIVLLLKNL